MKQIFKQQALPLALLILVVGLIGTLIYLLTRRPEQMSDYSPGEVILCGKTSYERELRRAKDPTLIQSYYTSHYNNTDTISPFAAKDSDTVLSLPTGIGKKIQHSGNPYVPRGWITDSMSPLNVFTDDIDKEYSWNK